MYMGGFESSHYQSSKHPPYFQKKEVSRRRLKRIYRILHFFLSRKHKENVEEFITPSYTKKLVIFFIF